MKAIKRLTKVLVLLSLCVSCVSSKNLLEGVQPLDTLPIAPKYEEGKFDNWLLSPVMTSSGFKMMKSWIFNENQTKPEGKIPVLRMDRSSFSATPSEKITFWWMGHSSLIVEMGGYRFMIDPVLSKYASPVPGFVKRFSDSPLSIKELPEIDFMVLSHNHYDHLDKAVIKALNKQTTRFLVPTGVGDHIRGWGVESDRIVELFWWQETTFESLKLIFVPSRHFSNRGIFDRNESLWGGWIIKSDMESVYYSGDTGYADHFKMIGKIHGPFDLAIMENGAYNEQWPHVHSNGTASTQGALDVGCKYYIPVHWGAFDLSLHDWDEPIIWAYREAQKKRLNILTPMIGQRVELGQTNVFEKWWETVDPKTGKK